MSNRSKRHPIDVHVGAHVRLRRMAVGLTQEKMGECLGVSFQQQQKYEKGDNRIGASRLFQISQILNTTVQSFFDGLPNNITRGLGDVVEDDIVSDNFLLDFIKSRDGLELNRAFIEITSPRVRKRIVELVRALGPAEVI